MSGPYFHRVLLVEDDAPLAEMVRDFLQLNQFHVTIEHDGQAAIRRVQEESPDLILLDINLPSLDGLEVCRQIRPHYSGSIIMLTARGRETDEVQGFAAGADDYIAKPVRPRALLARLQTHLSREQNSLQHAAPIEIGRLSIDPNNRSAELGGQRLDLTTAEFDLLYLLGQEAGKPLSRQQIFQAIHGLRYDGMDRSIDLRISRLRKKLGDDSATPSKIISVRGVGYMLAVES